MNHCSSVEPLLAALAFDALDDVERPAVERHLAECEHCRAAHARLVGLPALLDIAGSADVKIHAPPPLLEAALVAGLPGHGGRLRSGPRLNLRRRGSPRVRAGTLLGLVAVAAVLTAPALTGRPDQGLRLALTASAQGVGAAGVASLRVHPWGTEVDLEAHGLAPTRGAEIYEVWFVSDRARISAGTFTVGASGRVSVRLAGAAHERQYTSLGITREPDAQSAVRRGPNILRTTLPA